MTNEKKYSFIKVFSKARGELIRTIASTKEGAKFYAINEINHETEEYFVIRCDINKLWKLTKKHKKFMKIA